MLTLTPKTESVLFIVVAVMLFALLTLMAKVLGTPLLGEPLHPIQVSAGRFCFAFIILLPIVLLRKPSFHDVPWKTHFVRGISGWLGVTCLFAAASQIPLADANAISFMSVIVTMGLSIPLLGEKVGIRRWAAAGIALIGALILVKPGTEAFHPAAMLAVMSAFFIGLEAIFIKTLSNSEPPLRILFINNTIGAAISLCIISFIWTLPSLQQCFALISIGMTMLIIQSLNIQALKRMDASFVAPFFYGVPLFAAVFDWLIFNQIISMTSGIGIGLIMLGGVIICRRS